MRKTGLIATLLLMCTFIFSANAAETWVKVTETPESWEGDYLIVTGDYAFDGSLDEASIKSSGNSTVLMRHLLSLVGIRGGWKWLMM